MSCLPWNCISWTPIVTPSGGNLLATDMYKRRRGMVQFLPSRQNWTRLRITNRQIQLVVRAVQRVWTLGHTAPCSRSPVPGPSPSHSRVRVGICAYVSVIINKTMGGNSVEMLSSSQRSLRWLFDKDSHLLTCPLGVLSLPGPAEITIKCDNINCSWTYESNKSFK